MCYLQCTYGLLTANAVCAVKRKKVVRLVMGGVEQVVLISYLVVKNTATLSSLRFYYGLANAR